MCNLKGLRYTNTVFSQKEKQKSVRRILSGRSLSIEESGNNLRLSPSSKSSPTLQRVYSRESEQIPSTILEIRAGVKIIVQAKRERQKIAQGARIVAKNILALIATAFEEAKSKDEKTQRRIIYCIQKIKESASQLAKDAKIWSSIGEVHYQQVLETAKLLYLHTEAFSKAIVVQRHARVEALSVQSRPSKSFSQ